MRLMQNTAGELMEHILARTLARHLKDREILPADQRVGGQGVGGEGRGSDQVLRGSFLGASGWHPPQPQQTALILLVIPLQMSKLTGYGSCMGTPFNKNTWNFTSSKDWAPCPLVVWMKNVLTSYSPSKLLVVAPRVEKVCVCVYS